MEGDMGKSEPSESNLALAETAAAVVIIGLALVQGLFWNPFGFTIAEGVVLTALGLAGVHVVFGFLRKQRELQIPEIKSD
jgi:hypothetical protein